MTTKTRTTATCQWGKAILLALNLCLAAACSNDTDENQSTDLYTYQGEPIPIEVAAGSVEEFGAGPVTRTGQTIESFCEPLDDDFNMVTTIESVVPDSTTRPATRGALGKGIRFRIVAYRNNEVSTKNYAGMADYYMVDDFGSAALVDPTAPLALKYGVYKFVCYSYNTDANISDGFNGTTDTELNVDHGMDFSSCSLDNEIVKPDGTGTFYLSFIEMQRQCSRIYISVISLVGDVTKCDATLTNVNSSSVKWTLGATNLPNTATRGSSPVITWTDLNTGTVSSGARYLLPNDTRAVTLTLNMTVAGKDYKDKQFTIFSRDFRKGTSYKITAKVSENSIEVTGISFKVATGNVIAIPMDDTNPVQYKYQFQVMQGNSTVLWGGGDYFNWACTDPTDQAFNSSFVEDVCEKIGIQWRTPTQTDMMEFQNCEIKGVGSYDHATHGTVKGYYFGVKPTSPSEIPTNKDSYVFLPFAGFRNRQGVHYFNSDGYYWSRIGDYPYAYCLHITDDGTIIRDHKIGSNNGSPVRCIANK